MSRAFLTAFALAALFAAGGCSDSYVQRLAHFDPKASDAAPVVVPAPATDIYQVKWAGIGEQDANQTRRIVRKGDPIGFTSQPDGAVLAVAGPETFRLTHLPPSADRVTWTRTMRRGGDVNIDLSPVGNAVGTATVAAAFVTAKWFMAIVESRPNDNGVSSDRGRDDSERTQDETHHAHRDPVERP